MVLVGVLWGLRHYRKTPKIDRLLRRQLRRLKVPFLHDIYLPDGMDGQIHIDYLARAGDTIFVIDVIHCDGLLFAGDRMDRWSEVKGMRTYRFDNPLNGNLMRTGSVRSLVPNITVQGLVMFPDECEFPKGIPDSVLSLAQLNDAITAALGVSDASTAESAWRDIEGLVARH